MNRMTYLIGEPGAGKSTVMAALTRGWVQFQGHEPFAHIRWYSPIDQPTPLRAVELGKRRPEFSGTDALSMGVMPKAVEWISKAPYPFVLGEGDRLGSAKFFEAARQAGYRVEVVHIETSPDLAAARRRLRGSNQNETWLKGRLTKVRNLADKEATIICDGNRPALEIADDIARLTFPPEAHEE